MITKECRGLSQYKNKRGDFLIFLLTSLDAQQEKQETSGPASIHSELRSGQQSPQKPRVPHKKVICPLSHKIQPLSDSLIKMHI